MGSIFDTIKGFFGFGPSVSNVANTTAQNAAQVAANNALKNGVSTFADLKALAPSVDLGNISNFNGSYFTNIPTMANGANTILQQAQPSGFEKLLNGGAMAFDMYNKFKNDKMNRKIQEQQLSDMKYDRNRKEYENNRLDANRRATTEAYNNGPVYGLSV